MSYRKCNDCLKTLVLRQYVIIIRNMSNADYDRAGLEFAVLIILN